MTEIDELLRRDGDAWRRTLGKTSQTSEKIEASLAEVTRDAHADGASDRLRRLSVRAWLPAAVAAVAVAVVAVLIAVVRSHGDASAPSGGPGVGLPTAPVSADPRSPIKPPAGISTDGPWIRQLTGPVSGHLLSMPWQLLQISHGGRVLSLYYLVGDGLRKGGIYGVGFEVIQTQSHVELIAVSRDDTGGGDEAGSLAAGFGRIRLDRPLGDRALLHAPTDWSASSLPS